MLDLAEEAAKPPETDNWSALENERQSGTVMLLVSGKVQVASTNREPKLSRAGGNGSGPTLTLDLTVEAGDGPGADVLVWKPATFSERVKNDEFRDVEIRWNGEVIARCKVIDDEEAHARLVMRTEVANAKASLTMTASKAKKTAKAVLDKIGQAAATPAGKAAAGAAAVAVVGAAAVATAVSLKKPATAKKTKKKAAKKTPAKSAKKTKTKTKSKAAKKTKAKVKKAAKKRAAPKKKTGVKKSAAKKTVKRGAKKAKKTTRSRR